MAKIVWHTLNFVIALATLGAWLPVWWWRACDIAQQEERRAKILARLNRSCW